MDNNQTDIERADEIAGYLGNLGFIPGKQAPYVGFLSSNPSVMTSLGVLIDKINDGTVERHDYVHALTSLGGVALGVAELALLAAGVEAGAVLLTLGLGLAALDYADEHGYDPTEIKDDLSQKLDILNDKLNESSDWLDNTPDYISPDINDLFNEFKSPDSSHISPLVLDLDGDGIETFGISSQTNVVFDHDGDGIKNGTGWVKSDDGILVLDRNGNGMIDDGSELFGVYTQVNGTRAEDGFVALKSEDSNGDDKFDANDTNFANVRVWRDMDSDGVSDSGELFTLSELGIASIDLNYSTQNMVMPDGNKSIATSTFTKTDGTVGKIDDIDFITNNFYREFTDNIALNETALLLPDMQGSGMVRDLREASMISNELNTTLQTMQNQGYVTKDEMMSQIDNLLSQWANTSTMHSNIETAGMLGNTLLYVPYGGSYIKQPFVEILNSSSGTQYPEEYGDIIAEQANISKMIQILEKFNGETFLQINGNVFQGFGDTILTTDSTAFNVLIGGNSLTASSSTPLIFAQLSPYQLKYLEQSYDSLKASVYDGLVLQTRLKPYIDSIELTIDENGLGLDISGVIQMLNSRAEVNVKNAILDWDDIVYYAQEKIGSLDSDAMIELNAWLGDMIENPLFSEQLKGITEEVVLHDGALYIENNVDGSFSITIDENIPSVSSGNDIVTGSSSDDIIDGKAGNDTIITGAGADILIGGSGNDTLIASSGDDILDGGTGNDILQGGMGNDTYFFGFGYGKDIIYDSAYTYGYTGTDVYQAGSDTIRFGEGITVSNIIARIDGNNLILAIKEDGKTFEELSDVITLTNWYSSYNRIENITFDDGTTLNTINAILSLVITDGNDVIKGTETALNIDAKDGDDVITASNTASNMINGGAGNDNITTGSGSDTIYGDDGNDTIYTGGGNDTIYGGSGNDVIAASSGDDILDGGTGNDILQGGMGNDTYFFGFGYGKDIIYDSAYTYGYTGTDVYQAGSDTIRFGEGITVSNIIARIDGNNLILAIKEDGKTFDELSDTITITNWYSANNKIENIIFDDGTILQSDSDISSLFVTSNSNNGNIFTINSKTAHTITDFSSIDDKIYLENAIFTDQDLIQTGNLNSAFFKDLTNGGTRDSNDYFLYNQNTGNLFYDQEGFGGTHGAILIATITDNMGNHPSISYSNLVII